MLDDYVVVTQRLEERRRRAARERQARALRHTAKQWLRRRRTRGLRAAAARRLRHVAACLDGEASRGDAATEAAVGSPSASHQFGAETRR